MIVKYFRLRKDENVDVIFEKSPTYSCLYEESNYREIGNFMVCSLLDSYFEDSQHWLTFGDDYEEFCEEMLERLLWSFSDEFFDNLEKFIKMWYGSGILVERVLKIIDNARGYND